MPLVVGRHCHRGERVINRGRREESVSRERYGWLLGNERDKGLAAGDISRERVGCRKIRGREGWPPKNKRDGWPLENKKNVELTSEKTEVEERERISWKEIEGSFQDIRMIEICVK